VGNSVEVVNRPQRPAGEADGRQGGQSHGDDADGGQQRPLADDLCPQVLRFGHSERHADHFTAAAHRFDEDQRFSFPRPHHLVDAGALAGQTGVDLRLHGVVPEW
jgi:hypothetical protein